MTCEEFKEIMNADNLLKFSTQAERSIIYNHFMNCKSCHEMIMAMPWLPDAEAEKLAEEDRKIFKLFSEN